MKNRNILMACALFLLSSCDLIHTDNYTKEYVPPLVEGKNARKIVLEDYTGMNCSQCYKATDKANFLKKIHGNRLITVAIHAGYFAIPINGIDLKTADGDEYNSYFDVSGNPKGIVNRLPYNKESYYGVEKWEGAVAALPLYAPYAMEMKVKYDNNTREYDVMVDISRYELNKESSLNLVLWLVEDSVITSQRVDKLMVPNYCQRHVFRDALNGSWGEPFVLPIFVSDAKKYENQYILSSKFNDKNCSVVALLFNEASKEIIQAVEMPIKE